MIFQVKAYPTGNTPVTELCSKDLDFLGNLKHNWGVKMLALNSPGV